MSDSFSLHYRPFNLYPSLRLLSFLPWFPHAISSSHLTFSRLVFLVIMPCFFFSPPSLFPLRRPPFGTLCLLSLSFPPPPLPGPHSAAGTPLPLPFTPPRVLFCLSCSISLSFHHHHPPQQSMKNRCRTTLSVICDFNAMRKITARLCAAVANPNFNAPLLEFAQADAFLGPAVINCTKIYHLNKSFYEAFSPPPPFFFPLPGCVAMNGGNGRSRVINERRGLPPPHLLTVLNSENGSISSIKHHHVALLDFFNDKKGSHSVI